MVLSSLPHNIISIIIQFKYLHTPAFSCAETKYIKAGCTFVQYIMVYISDPEIKNAVSTNIKHSRYIHLMSNFLSIRFHTKRLYVHMFDIVDTPFRYGRGLIICSSLQKFSKIKESSLCVILNADAAFLLCGADMLVSVALHPGLMCNKVHNECKELYM